ncbi:ABC transporter, ATP-binding protein, partial [gut metagenome]
LSEVSAVCDYVLIISHGKLVASDTPENLSRLAAGSHNLTLLIKGRKEEIRKALEEIQGTRDLTLEPSEEAEVWKIKMTTEEQLDVREKVFYKMAEHHCPILEMKSDKASLEQIFLELTEDEKKENLVDSVDNSGEEQPLPEEKVDKEGE